MSRVEIHSLRFLLIGIDHDILGPLQAALQSLDPSEVETVSHGGDGVTGARRFDVIIAQPTEKSDTGAALARTLRNAGGVNGETPLIMIAPRPDKDALAEAMEAGVAGFITLPIAREKVGAQVRHALRIREA